MSVITILIFILAGILQEALVVSYHRSIAQNRFLLTSICCGLITMLNLLVVAELSRAIFNGQVGLATTLCLVGIFALAKSVSSYVCLRWWHTHRK